MKKGSLFKLIVSSILIIIGVFVFVFNIVIVYNGDLKYLGYKSVVATVTSVQSKSSDGKEYYQASYNYEIKNESFAYNSNFTSDKNKFVIGEEGIIRYNPKNPIQCFLMEDSVLFNYL